MKDECCECGNPAKIEPVKQEFQKDVKEDPAPATSCK